MKFVVYILLVAVAAQAQLPPTNNPVILSNIAARVAARLLAPPVSIAAKPYTHLTWAPYTNAWFRIMASTNLADTNGWYCKTNFPIWQSYGDVAWPTNSTFEFYQIQTLVNTNINP